MSEILIVGGFKMKVFDGSAYWGLVDALGEAGHVSKIRECVQNTGSENEVTFSDLMQADSVITYSYGTASVKKLWHDNAQALVSDSEKYKNWIVLAGVPDFWMGEFYGDLWHKPRFVERVRCFDVKDIPVSCDFRDAELSRDLITTEPDDPWEKLIPVVNYHCDQLFPSVLAPGQKHIQLKERPEVLEAIVEILT